MELYQLFDKDLVFCLHIQHDAPEREPVPQVGVQ